jgi:hypothetical protein
VDRVHGSEGRAVWLVRADGTGRRIIVPSSTLRKQPAVVAAASDTVQLTTPAGFDISPSWVSR